MSERRQLSPFSVPILPHEEAGWRGKMSKWHWALLIGMPLAAAVALASFMLLLKNRRSKSSKRESSPPGLSSQSPIPSALRAAKKPETDKNKTPQEQAQDLKSQGNEFYKQEKFIEAAKCYEEAVKLSEGSGEGNRVVAVYHQNLAAVYDAMARKEADKGRKISLRQVVIENCDKAIALNPRYVKALVRRFQMHYVLGHKDEALLDVTRALVLDQKQGELVSKQVANLLKDITYNLATGNFPKLGPLAPPIYLVRAQKDSFVWQDDLSEKHLKDLWLLSRPAVHQFKCSEQSHDSEERSISQPEQEGVAGEALGQMPLLAVQAEEEAGKEDQRSGDRQLESGEEAQEEEQVVKEAVEEREDEGEKEGEEKEVEEEGEERVRVVQEDEGATRNVPQNEASEDDLMSDFAKEPFVVAAAQFSHNELDNILELLGDAIEKGDPVFKPHALLLRGSLCTLWRMEKEALSDLQEVINMEGLAKGMYVNALVKKAGVFAGSFEMDKCKACFEKAQAILPGSTDILAHRAKVALESGNLNSVLEDLETAVQQAPHSPYICFNLASAYHRSAGIHQSMQLIGTAQAKFEEAKKKYPEYADGLILYSMFVQDLNDVVSAEESLIKAIQLEPDNPMAHFSLGLLTMLMKSDLDQAMLHLQKAIEIDSSCVNAYDTMASVEMHKGNVARSLELYEKAIQFSRNPFEMSQAYLAEKISAIQAQVCDEYGIKISTLSSGNPFSMSGP